MDTKGMAGMELGLNLLSCCVVGVLLGWAVEVYGLGHARGVVGGMLGAVVGFVAWMWMLWRMMQATGR